MADTGPNPYASPASQPQPNVMDQFNVSGVDVMNNPRRGGLRPPTNMGGALGQMRQRNATNATAGQMPMAPTKPAAVGAGGILAPEGGSRPSVETMGQTRGRPMDSGYLSDLAGSAEPGQMTNANGVRVGRIRPPRSMGPVRAYR